MVYNQEGLILEFLYSEKDTNFCEISTVDLSYIVTVKCTVQILQNFVAFSEYLNFTHGQVNDRNWALLFS